MATYPFTGEPLQQAEMLYIGYFGRAGDPSGAEFWTSFLVANGDSHAALEEIAGTFSVTPEARAEYPFLAHPLIAGTAEIQQFVNSVYQNLFGRDAEQGGLNFWTAYFQAVIATNDLKAIEKAVGESILTIADIAGAPDQAILSAKVTQGQYLTQTFLAAGIDTFDDVALLFAREDVASVHSAADLANSMAATDAFAANPPSGETFELTVGQDTFRGTGRDVFNAPLDGVFGDQPTLTHLDSLRDTGVGTTFTGFSQVDGYGPAVPTTGPAAALAVNGAFFGSVLNASFDTSQNDMGGDIWNFPDHAGNDVLGVDIRGIQTWNINAVNTGEYGGGIVITGDAALGNLITGLKYLNFFANSGTSSLAIGNNTQPVQTLLTTITVHDAVGTGYNGVDVDISALAFSPNGTDAINVVGDVIGAFPLDSGGSLIVPDPIVSEDTQPGFDDEDGYCVNWEGFQEDAYAIATGASSGPVPPGLPGTGAIGYGIWNVYSIDAWKVEPPIDFGNWVLTDATGTKGGVNIFALGGEGSQSAHQLTLHDDGSSTILFSTFISDSQGAEDWQNLTDINLSGTSGFVVLSGAEIGRVNDTEGLLSDVGTASGGVKVTIEGGQGNSFYDLTSFSAATAALSVIDGGHGTLANSEVAFNNDVLTLPSGNPVNISHIQVLDDASDAQGGTIDMLNFINLQPLNADYTLLGGGTVRAGFELLQFLGADGCTDTTLTKNLVINHAPERFAINMQDMADSGWNITVLGLQPSPLLPANAVADIWVSDGDCPTESVDGGDPVYNVPVFAIDNYLDVNIFLPSEHESDSPIGDDDAVFLGSNQFLMQPVLQLNGNATLNFRDDAADTGNVGVAGTADALYLGHTVPADALATQTGIHYDAANAADLIGHATVIIDQFVPPDQTTTINDFGHGRFEIGATDVNILNGLSTSNLIMDLPATGGNGPITVHGFEWSSLAHGITVIGSENGVSLLQGTSGPIQLDYAAVHFDGLNDAYFGAVGNDNITSNFGGTNIFGAGGLDHITLNGGANEDVWIGAYDIGTRGTGDPCTWTDPGRVLEQAITDYNPSVGGSGHAFVNGYGTDNGITTVSGYQLGDTNHGGDILTFSISDWFTNTVDVEQLLTFHDFPVGTVITNQYAADGVLFSGTTGLDPIIADDGAVPYTPVLSPNPPFNGEFQWTFPTGADHVQFDSGFWDALGAGVINVYNTANVLVGTVNNTVTGVDHIDLSGFGTIGRITFNSAADPAGADIGNLQFSANASVLGLTQWDGSTHESVHATQLFTVGTAGDQVAAGTDVLLDNIGAGYNGAAALETALESNTGFVKLADGGVKVLDTVDMLIAYKATDGGINIADVTIDARNATADVTATNDLHGATLAVHDLVHLVGLPAGEGLANFVSHNIVLHA